MQYYVSIENTTYFYWQIELLIESFKRKGIQDDLVIAIAENTTQKNVRFSKNILSHKNKFIHHNYGEEVGYKPLNKYYGLIIATTNKNIHSPFAVLHPDMVLIEPIDIEKHKENIVFHNGINDPVVMAAIRPELEETAKASNLKVEDFPQKLPLGNIIVYQNTELDLFHRILWRMNLMRKKYNQETNFNLQKAAITLTILENLGKYTCKGIPMECNLVDHQPFNFVHYKYGLPPVFNKKSYVSNVFMPNADPFTVLLEHNPTPVTDYVQKIIRSYLGS
jgi:hypothetical protein